MKRLALFIFIGLLAMATVACDSQQPESVEGTPAMLGETTEVGGGIIGATEAATEPGAIVIEPVPAATSEVAGAGGETNMPVGNSSAAAVDTTGLPAVAHVQVIPATPYDNSQPPSPIGLPEHIRIDFDVEGQSDPTATKPVMYIIPTADYAALWEGAGDMGVSGTLAGLQALIRDQMDPFPEAGIPVLPVERVGSAFNDLAVQGKYLDLEGMSGLRFVGRFVEMADPVSNQGLTYVFQGFTDDGQYYISFLYPIATPQLPGDATAVDPTELELYHADTAAYMAERVAALNGLSDTDWTPSLSALDALVASLQIPGPATTDVVVAEKSPLTDTTWQWVSSAGTDGAVAVVDPARYTVAFNEDGSTLIQADCNTVIAGYTTSADNGISLIPGPSTLVACPEDSQDQHFLAGLFEVGSYAVEGDALTLVALDGSLSMQFAAAGDVAEGVTTEETGSNFLTNGTWQWTSTNDPLGISTVAEPSRYTIAFNMDGSAAIQADCNTVLASYTTTEEGGMSIQLGPTTLVACAPDSLNAEFLQSLAAVVFYSGAEGDLSLEMMADGGIMSFAHPSEEAAIVPEGSVTAGSLIGPVWQWTVLRQLNGETAVPEPARYTVSFNSDGTASIQADCNVVGATYQAGTDGSLSMVLGPSTLALCGDASLDQVFLGGLGASQSYGVADGALSITLQFENGTMVFVPTN